jgi:hypothetical protein
MASKGVVGTVNFDVKTKLEEKERKSQMSVIGFSLFLSTKPSIVKFQVDGSATLTGKDADIQKMLEVDPETKIPLLFQRVYQSAFTAMYLMSTILNTPPPPNDLLHSDKQASPVEGVSVEVGTEDTEEDGVTVEVATEPEEKAEAVAPRK